MWRALLIVTFMATSVVAQVPAAGAHDAQGGPQYEACILRDRTGRGFFTNTFAYDRAGDTWTWALDNVKGDKSSPFLCTAANRRHGAVRSSCCLERNKTRTRCERHDVG